MVGRKISWKSQFERQMHNSRTILMCLLWNGIICYMWGYVTCELQESHGPNGHWHIPAALWTVSVAVRVQWACEHTTIVEQSASTPPSCKAQFLYIIPAATELPQRIQSDISLHCCNCAGYVQWLGIQTGYILMYHFSWRNTCHYWYP
jgi:hypothetical protein